MAVVNHLIQHPDCAFEDILRNLSTLFPGLLTPSLGLVRAVLTSYAEETDGQWKLRREDFPSTRKEDLASNGGADSIHRGTAGLRNEPP